MAYDEQLAARVRALLAARVDRGEVAEVAERRMFGMDFTGRPSRGSVYVDPAGTASDAALADWVARGAAFAAGR